jgi:hypothetical protein
MNIKVMENPIPTGYMDLEDCILSLGEEGRKIFDGLIRRRFTNNDIHPPLDGHSLRSRESQPFFITITRK